MSLANKSYNLLSIFRLFDFFSKYLNHCSYNLQGKVSIESSVCSRFECHTGLYTYNVISLLDTFGWHSYLDSFLSLSASISYA